MKKVIVLVVVLAALGVLAQGWLTTSAKEEAGVASVAVERGSVALEALAVGRLEARFEVPVKSTSSGVVTRTFVALGQKVKKGDPLCEVRPVLTELQRLQAERALVAARENQEGVSELRGGENVAGWAMRLVQGGKSLDRMERGAERARSDAEGQLQLLLEGQAEIDGKRIDYVIRAPIDGHVITLDVEEGEPVVPSSSFGSGTVLLTLADLDGPVFRGTVDEIDVGRLSEGMTAELTVGARPDEPLEATLEEISLKAQSRNNAVVFDVELAVTPPEGFVMRSGYSAVARIRLQEARDVLVLPERVVDIRDGTGYVLREEGGERREVPVELGLSDGLTVEVRSGLAEGDRVLERTY
jgi:HlyD family secretion protein